MLKCCVRPLITLVLALMATCVVSTLSQARVQSSDTAPIVHASDSAKPKPIALGGGEPDQPLSPPPVRLNGGMHSPSMPGGSADAGPWVIRWISELWASLVARTAL